MKAILEKNTLNNNYMLYTSLNNGFAWFFKDLRAANKAKKKLESIIAQGKNLSYAEVTKLI
jgi:heterodisulfide reductase subunit A-like polyferredoxin